MADSDFYDESSGDECIDNYNEDDEESVTTDSICSSEGYDYHVMDEYGNTTTLYIPYLVKPCRMKRMTMIPYIESTEEEIKKLTVLPRPEWMMKRKQEAEKMEVTIQASPPSPPKQWAISQIDKKDMTQIFVEQEEEKRNIEDNKKKFRQINQYQRKQDVGPKTSSMRLLQSSKNTNANIARMDCLCKDNHNSKQCPKAHNFMEWRPRTCRNPRCNKTCFYWHSANESKKSFLERLLNNPDSYYSKHSPTYREKYL